jgi:hypothetical protein
MIALRSARPWWCSISSALPGVNEKNPGLGNRPVPDFSFQFVAKIQRLRPPYPDTVPPA